MVIFLAFCSIKISFSAKDLKDSEYFREIKKPNYNQNWLFFDFCETTKCIEILHMPQIWFDFHHHHALLLSRFREGGGIPLPLLLRHQPPPPPLAHHHLPKLLSWRWWSSPSRGGCAVWSSWCALQRKFLRQFFEIWNGNEGYFFGVEPRLYICCCFSSAKPSSLHFMFFLLALAKIHGRWCLHHLIYHKERGSSVSENQKRDGEWNIIL